MRRLPFVVLLLLAGCAGDGAQQRSLDVVIINETERVLRIDVVVHTSTAEGEPTGDAWNTTTVVGPYEKNTTLTRIPDGTYVFEAWYPGAESAVVRGISEAVTIAAEGDDDRAIIVRARTDEVMFNFCATACGGPAKNS